MDFLRRINNKVWFQLYINLCLAIFISVSSYIHVPLQSVKEYVIYIAHFALLQITLYGFTYLLTLNKWLFRIVFNLLFFIFSLISFWVYTLDITISVDLIQLSLESKPDIFFDLLSFPFFLFVIVLLIVLYSINVFYSRLHFSFEKRTKGLFFSIIAIALFFFLEENKYGVFKRRMPYIVVCESVKYFNKVPLKFATIDQQISVKNKINIVFVLGESVRAKNLQLNGYARETNPLLSKRKDVFSFSKIFTSNTYTSKSVPQILTSQSIYDKECKNVYSMYSVFNKANINTVWIGNQTPEVSYRDLIFQNKKVNLIDVEHSVLSYHKKHDGELLTIFKENYKNNYSNLYTIHMIGSHWWYEGRYPNQFKKYTPVVKTKYLPSNTKEEMINSYDNTIVYLDHFLNDIISFLEGKKDNTILIYLSDHGEILGEDGKWLHAQDHIESKNPACIVWISEKFKENYPDKTNQLKKKIDSKITTDFLYNSVLDLVEIQLFKYNRSKSIFSNNP